MDRRTFVAVTAAAVAAPGGAEEATVDWRKLPRWRGFNLLEKFSANRSGPFVERDFEWLTRWGFDFARIPMSYHCWSKPDDWLTIDEKVIEEIDQVVEFGRRYGVHINLNLHRAPGFCINQPYEAKDLWTDESALEACCFHWAMFARRYAGIPSTRLSFDLLNEPTRCSRADYIKVHRALAEAIRAADPQRLIIADGWQVGADPVPELDEFRLGRSTRGYAPSQVSHYRANWVKGSDTWPEPTWPLRQGDRLLDKAWLAQRLKPWREAAANGVGVHVGEFGAYNKTPHAVALAWLKDWLELWQEAGFGWALWNLRGAFGLVDSGRADVAYEAFEGHQLDRALLELLQAH